MADAAYGLWPLGAFTAFLVVLFTKMYGVPLTVRLLGSWLGVRFPLHDAHAGGHLWNDLNGWPGDPHLSPFHLRGHVAISGGFWPIAVDWGYLHDAAPTTVIMFPAVTPAFLPRLRGRVDEQTGRSR